MCVKISEIYKNLASKAKPKDLSKSGKCFHKWNGNALTSRLGASTEDTLAQAATSYD